MSSIKYPKQFNDIIRKIKENPRKCEICGKTETIEDIILKYDNGKCMCDDCAYEIYGKVEFL